MDAVKRAERISIRKSYYRGREGFLVCSGRGFFRTAIFVRQRETADAIKRTLKLLPYPCTVRHNLIDAFIREDAQ